MAAHVENLVILFSDTTAAGCDRRTDRQKDRQTDRQTELRWLRRAESSSCSVAAFARKKRTHSVNGYFSFVRGQHVPANRSIDDLVQYKVATASR